MKHKHIKKSNIDKISDFYKAIDSTSIEIKDCREIFDNAVEFSYGKHLDEYKENTIESIMVNEIRHNCSNYNKIFKEVYKIRRSDKANDYFQYKNVILNKIAMLYPYLEDECNRQKCKLEMVKICK